MRLLQDGLLLFQLCPALLKRSEALLECDTLRVPRRELLKLLLRNLDLLLQLLQFCLHGCGGAPSTRACAWQKWVWRDACRLGGEAAWGMSMGSGINREVWPHALWCIEKRAQTAYGHAARHAPCTGDSSSTNPMQAALQLLLLRLLLLSCAPLSAQKSGCTLHSRF